MFIAISPMGVCATLIIHIVGGKKLMMLELIMLLQGSYHCHEC